MRVAEEDEKRMPLEIGIGDGSAIRCRQCERAADERSLRRRHRLLPQENGGGRAQERERQEKNEEGETAGGGHVCHSLSEKCRRQKVGRLRACSGKNVIL